MNTLCQKIIHKLLKHVKNYKKINLRNYSVKVHYKNLHEDDDPNYHDEYTLSFEHMQNEFIDHLDVVIKDDKNEDFAIFIINLNRYSGEQLETVIDFVGDNLEFWFSEE